MIRHFYIFICAAFLITFYSPNKAFAAAATCIPGAPCLVPLTANDPQNPTDGPNYTGPNAPKSEIDSCSADFMNQIHARSFIEANREIMIAGGVITRPDSILEYTCFEERAQEIGSTAAPIFTTSSRWNPASVPVPSPDPGPIQIQVFMGTNKVTQSIQNLVLQSLGSYTGTFPTNYLGGIPGGPAKGCGVMDTVYRFAKCENVNDAIHIMSFDDLIATDPRNLAVSAGTCTGPNSNPITAAMVSLANNDGGAHAHKDDALTYLDFVGVPPSAGVSCAAPIPTGLLVSQPEYDVSPSGLVTLSAGSPAPYPEMICSTPGCYFTGGPGGTCQR